MLYLYEPFITFYTKFRITFVHIKGQYITEPQFTDEMTFQDKAHKAIWETIRGETRSIHSRLLNHWTPKKASECPHCGVICREHQFLIRAWWVESRRNTRSTWICRPVNAARLLTEYWNCYSSEAAQIETQMCMSYSRPLMFIRARKVECIKNLNTWPSSNDRNVNSWPHNEFYQSSFLHCQRSSHISCSLHSNSKMCK